MEYLNFPRSYINTLLIPPLDIVYIQSYTQKFISKHILNFFDWGLKIPLLGLETTISDLFCFL